MSYANYLHITPSSAGNRKKFTISTWFKKSKPSGQGWLLTVDTYPGGNMFQFQLDTSGNIGVQQYSGSTSQTSVTTNNLLRDLSAWYHVVLRVDTTQATASDRVRIYLNGEEASYNTTTYPSQNFDYAVNNTVQHQINSRLDATSTNGQSTYFAHYHLCDGYSYAPTEFGQTDSTTGIWKPVTSPSVSYGTNGFFLKFQDTSNFGDDSSGNTNDLTTVGTITQAEDTPSNNFATLNPLQSNLSLTNGNTSATTTNYKYGLSTLAVSSGKWYVEMKVTHGCMIMGIQDMIKANDGLRNTAIFWSNGSESYHLDGFSRFTHDSYGDISTSSTDYPTYGSGDIVMMAVDLDNNKLAYGKNGTWYNSADPSNGTNMVTIDAPSTLTSGYYGIVGADTCSASDGTFEFNFGNGYFGTTAVASSNSDGNGYGLFEYSVPTGYYSLCTKNLKEFG